MTETTRAGLIRSLRGDEPLPRRVGFDFDGVRIDLRTNAERLARMMDAYFRPFLSVEGAAEIVIDAVQGPPPVLPLPWIVKPREKGKKEKEEYVDLPGGRAVRKRLTGMVFVFGGGEHLAAGPCEANANQVVNFINNRYMEKRLAAGDLLGHAAGVELGGRGLAIAGFSGMGKSTLALHLLSRGARFVSNDRVMIDADGGGRARMRGVAKLPRINPGTAIHNPHLERIVPPEKARRYAGLPPDELWSLEEKYDVPIEECFGPSRFVLGGPLDGLAVLNWRRGAGGPRIDEAGPERRSALLPAFMKETGLFFLPPGGAPPDPDLSAYEERLRDVPVLEIAGGVDFAAAAAACLRFLEGGSP